MVFVSGTKTETKMQLPSSFLNERRIYEEDGVIYRGPGLHWRGSRNIDGSNAETLVMLMMMDSLISSIQKVFSAQPAQTRPTGHHKSNEKLKV